jgi:mono/diheme cytochrome c family protein
MNESRPLLILFMIALLTFVPARSVPAKPKSTPAKPKRSKAPQTAVVRKGDLSKGKILFRHYCAVCHGVSGQGDGPNAEHLDPRPADLSDAEYMASATEETITTVIRGGGAALDISQAMPPWGKTFTKEQIADLVVYVQSLSKKHPVEKQAYTRLEDLEPVGELECQVCHMKQGERRQIAPDLDQEGSKLNKNWLYSFLKKPVKIRPVGFMPLTKSVMPNFQFTDEEALSLTEFLMTKKDPKVSKSVLGEFRVTPEEIKEGKRLFTDVYSCDGCHQIGGKGGIVGPNLAEARDRLRPEWIATWLKRPQALRPDSPMPTFGLQDHEIKALLAYILSAGEGPSPVALPVTSKTANELIESGKLLVKNKNCVGCHLLEMDHGAEQKPQRTAEKLSVIRGGIYSDN